MNARMSAPPIDPGPESAADPVQQSGVAAPLANGASLGPYRVTGVVGQGGFGIVYRAEDPASGAEVAIKEFLPAQLATRLADGSLAPAVHSHAETFAAGLEGFLDEARLLARVRHPGLVEVLQAWEQNGTAYMSMPRYEGPTLERLIAAHPSGIDAPTLKAIVAPLLGALATIDRKSVV
jgi:serine/threonine protein kinase